MINVLKTKLLASIPSVKMKKAEYGVAIPGVGDSKLLTSMAAATNR